MDSCTLPHKDSRSNCKQFLVDIDAIDEYMNLKDETLFMAANKQMREQAEKVYQIVGQKNPFLIDDFQGARKVVANMEFHRMVDSVRKRLGLYADKIAGKLPKPVEDPIKKELKKQILDGQEIPTQFAIQELKGHSGLLWSTDNTELGLSKSDYATILSSLQPRIGNRSFQEVWNSREFTDVERDTILLYSIQQRLLTGDTFNSRLFRKLNRQLELPIHIIGNSKYPIYVQNKAIYIDLAEFRTLIDNSKLSDVNKYIEIVLSEELIHVVSQRLMTSEDYENIRNELTEGGKKSIKKIYSMGNIPDDLAVAEYIRMLVQQRFLGTTTEQTRFTNFEALFSWIWEYLIEVFKGNKGELKRQYYRHFDYIDDYEFYNMGTPYDTNPELYGKLEEFGKKLNPNFRIEILDQLTSNGGNSVDAIAKISQFLIQLQRGKESSLPEEIAHFFVELLDKESSLFKRMNDEIVRTRIYKDTVQAYKKEYGNDTERLKREASAKLIALYLTDKKAFKYQSGSDSLVENLIRLFKEFFGFLKRDVSPFASAAQDILDLDVSQLTESYINKEDMYALSDSNFQTIKENLNNYDKVIININDTLFDYKGYKGTDKEKRDIIFGPRKDEYYTNVNLTTLGKELKDKINEGWVDPTKLILTTKMVITPALRSRIEAEFGKVEIKRYEEEQFATNEEGQTIQIPAESEEEYIKSVRDTNKKVLLVDNKPVKVDGIKIKKYDNRYAKYENPALVRERERREKEGKKVTQKLREEIESVLSTEESKKGLLEKIIYATNIIRKQFSKMEWMENKMKEMSQEEVQELFKDNEGFLGLPVAAAQRIFKMVKEGNRVTDAVVDFIATIETTTAFFAQKNNAKYRDIYESINSGDPKQVERAIQELNMLVKMADSWKEWTGQFSNFISEHANTVLMRGAISRMNAEIERVKIYTLPLSQFAIQKTLSPIFNVYNENKQAQIEDKKRLKKEYEAKGDTKSAERIQATIEQLEKGLMNPETIVKALRGELDDLSSITVWVKNLYNSEDVLVSGVASLIKERELKSNTESIIRSQQFGEKVNNLRVKYNLTDDDIRSILTLEKVRVWNNEKEEYEEKDALALMNLWKNREDFFKKREPMLKAYDTWKEDKTDENLRLYFEAKRVFESWKNTNWHDEYTEEFYTKYDALKQTPEDAYIYDKATSTQNQLWAKVRELSESLEYQTDEKEIERINTEIKDTVREAKNLKSNIDLLGNDKVEEDLQMAEMLQKKQDIDKDFYEYKSDNKRFKTDLKSLVTSFDPLILPDDVRENLLMLIDTANGNYSKLAEYIRSEPSVPDEVVKWLERNTVNRYAQEFYDSRKEITDKLSEAFKELSTIYGEDNSDIDEIWQKIFNESSYTRDEDGVLDGSNATPTTQDLVKRFEEEMERIKELATANRSLTSLSKPDASRVKELKKIIAEKVEELQEIQSKDTTDYYMETFVDYAEETGFTNLLQKAGIDLAYGLNLSQIYNSLEFKTLMVNNPDHPFIQWFTKNHYY